MKFVLAIVQDYDTDRLLRAVKSAGLRATRLASTGGFLRTGNTTVFMGVEDDRVAECLGLIQQSCQTRVDVQADAGAPEFSDWYAAGVHDVTIGGAVVFIVPVYRFERIQDARSGDQ
ncbi:MAG: cyclic-di-AMP receptor [Thermomicrobiales bacterium]